jgi:hypothetical protein
MGNMRNVYNILVGNSEGKIPPGRHKHIWDDNIRMDLRKMGWKYVDWMHLAQDRDQWRALVNMVMKLPSSIKGGEFLDCLSDC